ncbi:coadhesin-like [Osmia bicornis bicornis]|uniref:coadhesin-like n=1 Tax=Osmia bicornis bicornis TaxID=1437191 RepID=UPI0010F68078|nr:coadhesin-like [Osmia bicornis bicornis]
MHVQNISVKIKCSLILLLYLLIGEISNTMQDLDCDLGLKDDNLCPIDGGWTSWSSWGLCSGKCGFKGKRTRHRICNNPLPSNDGAPCIGSSYQTENCQIIGCRMNDYEEVVSNHPIRKKEMEIVKNVHKRLPALIELCFFVDCTFFIVEKILGSSAMLYWNAMNCVKYNVGCPRPGGWSTWEAWSPCTAICGRGQKYRTRNCNSPVPSNSELMCNNSAFEVKSCMGLNCQTHPAGTWINWSGWSVCSVECGNGIQVRKRSCSEIQNIQGSSCKGSTEEIKGCSINKCSSKKIILHEIKFISSLKLCMFSSVNGIWSSWTVWTACTSSCGIGTQLRNRMCNNPSPSGNGTSCSGSASEVRQCFSKPCSVRSHEVAYFTEKSSLLYNVNGKHSRLLHLYVRFLPLSPFGVIIYRFENNCKGSMCDFVKLFLHNGRIILLSKISGCTLGLVHEHKLEIGQWYVVLIAIYGTRGMLRVNDNRHEIATFSCIPMSYNLDHAMKVGEFHGQLQEIAINFAPVQFHASKVTIINFLLKI